MPGGPARAFGISQPAHVPKHTAGALDRITRTRAPFEAVVAGRARAMTTLILGVAPGLA